MTICLHLSLILLAMAQLLPQTSTASGPVICELPAFLSAAEAVEYQDVYARFVNAKRPPLPTNAKLPHDCYYDAYAEYIQLSTKHVDMNTKACKPYSSRFPAERFKIWYLLDTNKCRIQAKFENESNLSDVWCDYEALKSVE